MIYAPRDISARIASWCDHADTLRAKGSHALAAKADAEANALARDLPTPGAGEPKLNTIEERYALLDTLLTNAGRPPIKYRLGQCGPRRIALHARAVSTGRGNPTPPDDYTCHETEEDVRLAAIRGLADGWVPLRMVDLFTGREAPLSVDVSLGAWS